ncbi:MAG: sodium/glutamate symporter, partial [Pseudomonadota bacterium]
DFITVTVGLAVFLLGGSINRRVPLLRALNIPEPVTGGLLAAAALLALHALARIDLSFETETRDLMLVFFFTGIGLNARLADLSAGGRPLARLLALTAAFIVVQNLVGVLGALAFGLPAAAGPLLGSAALIGGHGTALAWAPRIAETHGLEGAAELGVAVATLGLVAAALVGGPMAGRLIRVHALEPARPEEDLAVGAPQDERERKEISAADLMRTLLLLHVCVILGFAAHRAWLDALGLPLFVPCLMVGIALGNLQAALRPDLPIRGSPALALISNFALGTFLAISLASLQLWTLAGLGGPILGVLAAQILLAVGFTLFVVFPVMGGGYRAAVLCAGFGGFALGATPTAIANMTAVTERHGPSPMAFVILPLVSAFFVDLANTVAIQAVLAL